MCSILAAIGARAGVLPCVIVTPSKSNSLCARMNASAHASSMSSPISVSRITLAGPDWLGLAGVVKCVAPNIDNKRQSKIGFIEVPAENGRANWQFALIPSMRSFGKTRQTASLPNPAASAVNDGAAQNDILAFGTRIGVIARHDAQSVFAGLQVIRAPEVVVKSAFDDIGVNVVEFLAVQKYICASTFLRHRADQTNGDAFKGQRGLGACAGGDLARYAGPISVHVIFRLRLIAPIARPFPRRVVELHKTIRFAGVPLFQLRRFWLLR